MSNLILVLALLAPPDEAKPAATVPVVQSSQFPAAGGRAEFDQVYAQWKALLGQLRDLRQQFSNVRPDDGELRPQLSKRYFALTKQGDLLLPKLVAAAGQAFQASGGKDQELAQFLVQVGQDAQDRDDYEIAAPVARLLADHGAQPFNELAALASFHVNDFDAAEKYFKQAAKTGRLSKVAQNVVPQLDPERKAWERERKLREKEAAANDLPRVKLETNYGDIVLELFENEAPNTVANFINLVEKDYYNGLTFHRVLPGFMAQGGCPNGNGRGGPGYMIKGEAGDEKVYRHHFRGSISMALGGDADSGGSQFFLTFVPTTHLDGKHTVFGRVIEGMEVLSRLKRRDPENNPLDAGDTILKATVVRKRNHPYQPERIEKPSS